MNEQRNSGESKIPSSAPLLLAVEFWNAIMRIGDETTLTPKVAPKLATQYKRQRRL